MKCLLYARVSTEKQAEKELSIPAQLEAMRAHAAGQGWDVAGEYLEAGASESLKRLCFNLALSSEQRQEFTRAAMDSALEQDRRRLREQEATRLEMATLNQREVHLNRSYTKGLLSAELRPLQGVSRSRGVGAKIPSLTAHRHAEE